MLELDRPHLFAGTFLDWRLFEPPDPSPSVFSDRGRDALKPDNDPDFFFKGKPGEFSAALSFRFEYRSDRSIVHIFKPSAYGIFR